MGLCSRGRYRPSFGNASHPALLTTASQKLGLSPKLHPFPTLGAGVLSRKHTRTFREAPQIPPKASLVKISGRKAPHLGEQGVPYP